jgi:hypothetical protein
MSMAGETLAMSVQARYDGPPPATTHYNNQYDRLHRLLVQFLLSGDQRSWKLDGTLAQRIIDIDTHYTDRARSAYSGGLPWHTAHHHDAGLATYRSM